MIGLGTLLNALGIVAGSIVGRFWPACLSARNQAALKVVMGAYTVWLGLSTTWQALRGSVSHFFQQLLVVILAMMLGKLLGKLLRLQALSNSLGRFASDRFNRTQKGERVSRGDGFVACAVLFCVAPLAVLGAIEEGLAGRFQPLALKALMDGLAMMAFVRAFGPTSALSLLPVVAYQGTLTLLFATAAPHLERLEVVDPIHGVAGLLVFCVALIILELKKVELADYLPSLFIAPVLSWLFR